MKKIMKKVLSLVLVVALAVLPMTVMAAEGDSVPVPDWQYCIYSGDTVTVEAGSTVFYEIGTDGTSGTYDFVVEGTGDFKVSICTEDGQGAYIDGASVSATDGKVKTKLTSYDSTYGYGCFSITNNTTGSVEYTCSIVYPEGAQGNPKALTLAVGSSEKVKIPAGAQYYVSVTPPEMDKEFQLTITGNTGFYFGKNPYSMPTPDTDGKYVSSISANMYSGGVSTFYIANGTTTEQTYTVALDNMPLGSESNPEGYTMQDYATKKELAGSSYWYSWKAPEDGTFKLEVVTSQSSEQWTYFINSVPSYHSEQMSSVWGDPSSSEISVVAGEVVTFGFSIPEYMAEYDYWNGYGTGTGTVVFTTSFVAGTIDSEEPSGGTTTGGGNSSSGDNYVGSENPLVNGENAVSTEKDYTIFTFEPSETGRYTFTSTDGSKLAIVSYNGMWVTIEPSENTVKDTEVTWDCTGVGQSIWLAVDAANSDNANILIIKESLEVNEIKKSEYVNTVTPEAFTFSGDVNKLEYVNTEDATVDSAVLGSDGYYHLNSANGPILFVDLDDVSMNLIDAMSYGQLKEVIYEDGIATEIIDYNNAFAKYVACADKDTNLYPLTVDLMVMYQNIGATQGWYGENGFVGGTAEDAWMFACYYQTGLTSLSTSTSNTTTSPDTGDHTNVTAWAIVMVVAAGAAFVVAESKRRAR